MGNLLTDSELENFRKILQNYEPNKEVLQQFKESNFAVIAGPAGAGKDTLRNVLLNNQPQTYIRIISTTTRPRRPGEQEAVDYYFKSPLEVELGLKRQEFFQVQLVHDQQVSCMHAEEIRKLGAGQIGLSILVVQTETQLREIKPDIKTIFLIPPSLDILRERMQAERVLSPDEIARRLSAAKEEMQTALQRPDYFCLVSGGLSELMTYADKFLQLGAKDSAADKRARQIIQKVLKEL